MARKIKRDSLASNCAFAMYALLSNPLHAMPWGELMKLTSVQVQCIPTWQNHVVSGLTRRSSSVANCWYELFETCGLPLNRSEGSAVFFCVRRYCPSIAFPFFEGENIEFERERGIIYDNGGEAGQLYLDSLIAHEILHLYGAVDLAPEKAVNSLKKYAKRCSNDVMHTPTQCSLDNYCIGDLTRYLIGWSQRRPAWLPQTTI